MDLYALAGLGGAAQHSAQAAGSGAAGAAAPAAASDTPAASKPASSAGAWSGAGAAKRFVPPTLKKAPQAKPASAAKPAAQQTATSMAAIASGGSTIGTNGWFKKGLSSRPQ